MLAADRGAGLSEPAHPLNPEDERLPEDLRSLLRHARTAWLPNTAVLSLLTCYRSCGLDVDCEPPDKPPGGTVFLYDRAKVRAFRKDGHNWKKKRDGRTVRETHEKLKVDNAEKLNCYYAHPESESSPQRRCYWQLDSRPDIVLVHYLVVDRYRTELLGSATQGSNENNSPGQSCGSVQGLSVKDAPEESEAGQPLGVFGHHDDLFDGSHSSLGLGTASMPGGLDMLGQHEASTLREQMEEDTPYSLLTAFPEVPGMHSQEGHQQGALMDMPSVVMDSEAVKLLKGARSVPHGASLEGMWSGNYHVNPQHLARSMPAGPATPSSPSALIPPIFDPSDFMDLPADPGGPLVPLDFPGLQEPVKFSSGQKSASPLPERRSARQLLARRSSTSSQAVESSGDMQGTQWGSNIIASRSVTQPEQDAHAKFFPVRPSTSQPDFTFNLSPVSGGYASAETQPAPKRMPPSPFESMGRSDPGKGPQMPPPSMPSGSRGPHSPRFQQPVTTHHMLDARSARSASADLSLKSITTHAGGVRWADSVGNLEGDYSHQMRRGRRHVQARSMDFEAGIADLKNRGLLEMDPGFVEMLPAPIEGQGQEFGNVIEYPKDLSRNMSAPAPMSHEEMFLGDTLLPELPVSEMQENTSSSTQMRANRLAPQRSLPYKLLDDYAPTWDYTTGGSKMILVCEIDDDNVMVPQDARLHVAFDQQEVHAKAISAGVIKAVVPPHAPGSVSVMLTLGNGIPLSNPVSFQYRPLPDTSAQQMKSLPIGASDRELQLHLIRMLTGGPASGGQSSAGFPATGWPTGDTFKGQHSYGLAEGRFPQEHEFSALGKSLAQLSPGELEKQLQRLIEKGVMQRAAKRLGNGMLQARGLKGMKQGDLLNCGAAGQSALHLLAGLGYDLALDTLLSAEADPYCKDANGLTPLHWAAARGKPLTVALLAAREADADSDLAFGENVGHKTCADLAAGHGHLGMAAFLAELQLQQSVLKLLEGLSQEGQSSHGLSIQRKRSRNLSSPGDISSDVLNIQQGMRSPQSSSICSNMEGATLREESGKDVHSIVMRAKNNAQQLEEASLRKLRRQTPRQQRKARTSPMAPSALGSAGNSFIDSDLSGDCQLNLDIYGAEALASSPDTSSLSRKDIQNEDFPNPFSDVSNTDMNIFDEDDSITEVREGTPSSLSEEPQRCHHIMQAMKHVERLVTAPAGVLHEYMYVRQAARIWLETKQGSGNPKHPRRSRAIRAQ